MAADYEYFVASPDRISALDLAKSPVSQLPAGEAVELPGVDPSVVLLALIEVLSMRSFARLLGDSGGEFVYDGGDAGPWVTVIDDFVVSTIKGADGDPELEWEDAVALWGDAVGEELEDGVGGGDVDEDALLEITDELRRLCGSADADHHLYCWTQL
ncbi:hypothetical protein [Cryptosporangium sp. NPDC051539]|uniref:hypothetical protein n=1 Tax=Cryptosporangium sp. NPDC051539 TaxID=3363962 RepID=UPI0037A313AD